MSFASTNSTSLTRIPAVATCLKYFCTFPGVKARLIAAFSSSDSFSFSTLIAACSNATPAPSTQMMERETGIEPATNSLEGCDSTTELLPRKSAVSHQPSALSKTTTANSGADDQD